MERMTYQAIGGHFVCLGTGKQGKGLNDNEKKPLIVINRQVNFTDHENGYCFYDLYRFLIKGYIVYGTKMVNFTFFKHRNFQFNK